MRPLSASSAQMGNGGIDAKSNHAGKKKTPMQLQSLEKFYSEVKYPKHEEMEGYAASLGLTYYQIRIWFKERRRKERKAMGVNVAHMDRQLGAGTSALGCSSNVRCFSNGQLCKNVNEVLVPEVSSSMARSMSSIAKKRIVRSQVLLPKDYILRKIFRKDGPPLGVEFDPPPQKAASCHKGAGSIDLHAYESQRTMKKRKIFDSLLERPEVLHVNNIPAKKHGIGKGLMTVWRATNSHNGDFPTGLDFIDETDAWKCSRLRADFDTVAQDRDDGKLVSKPIMACKKIEKRGKLPLYKRKVPCSRVIIPKKSPAMECHLSVDEPESSELQNKLAMLVDDEELELSELQAGPNPLRCSAHLSSSGRHGCPLCKDLLARFPPQSVKMKHPFSVRPWDSSPVLVKKLFKVMRFLYTHFSSIDVHPFTFDEFAQAFHDKDSFLLGKVHVGLLKLLLLHMESGTDSGFVPPSSKNCRFLRFLNFVREQEFDVNFWIKSLNPLTWIEILRQVLVAAGFGSKRSMWHRDCYNKEKNQMVKYGLRPRTLKGELFSLLSKRGSGGFKVSELAKSSQIVDLGLSDAPEELEQLIYSTLSSDITLFEKIASSAYRLRVDPRIKGKEDSRSDTECSGSVDDDDGDSSSSDDDSASQEMAFCVHERRIIKNNVREREVGQKLTKCSEIDESYSGETWLLGLMEGEYSDLSIDEKLDALVALVDLVGGAGSNLKLEEPFRAAPTTPNVQFRGSGGKIKKSTRNHHQVRDKSLGPGNEVSLGASEQVQSDGNRSRDYHGDSGKNCGSSEVSTEVVHLPQTIYLGSDRRYNNYWLFLGPCVEDDPGHRRIYFESSEDGHWDVIDSPQDLLSLLSVLDSRGTREARLLASLEKRQAFLFKAMGKYMNNDNGVGPANSSDPSHSLTSSGDGSSPISDIDNSTVPAESTNNFLNTSGAVFLELGRKGNEKKLKWERLQALDKWIWNSFYSVLNAVRCSKRSYMESLVRCESCHDLYWRDEKHCRVCHSTFEIDFDLEERYAVHVATCRVAEDTCNFPNHKVLPSQLQALKAAIHAIEAKMPEMALADSWMKSAHKLWVKRLRRTSSLPELLQVLIDFVGAINEDWLYKCSSISSCSYLDDITLYFQTMPQTTSAVALWVVKLDTLIAPHLEQINSDRSCTRKEWLPKEKQVCTR